MSDDEDGFLRAIRARPDDDAVRLVYADWLEEHGRPARAEFIRAQCAAEKVAARPEKQRLEKRADDLLGEHREEWTRAVRAAAPSLVPDSVQFRRGFPALVVTTATRYLRDPASFSRLADGDPGIAVRVLVDDLDQLRQVVECPDVGGIRALDLSACDIGDDGARVLAGAPNLSRLTSLNVSGSRVTDAGAAALAESTRLTEVRHLDLRGNRISAAAALRLIRSPNLARLRSLAVEGNAIDGHVLEEIDRIMAARNPDSPGPPRRPPAVGFI
ncbi:TIGR02996 domain-containing protein [Fimbriiglobus ruber]|uniref:TIGR02996 domain-containing protein n=1 Tax=Fimbriiglobus ruber TaxID=1908690 RepID=A0A225DQV5_9BACT|nr:TIGR02996 domain-containing protein [Fimbriiglobus ruber]OWK40988.1 hypothetical protein FRUB_04880 [Fimbriiglobus ruber]